MHEREAFVPSSVSREQDHSVPWWHFGKTSYWLALPFCLDTSCYVCLESRIHDASTSIKIVHCNEVSTLMDEVIFLVPRLDCGVLSSSDRMSIITELCHWAQYLMEQYLFINTLAATNLQSLRVLSDSYWTLVVYCNDQELALQGISVV